MTTLREAAQQALEALEGWDNYGKWVWPESALEQAKRNTTESLAALRAALAEPVQEPVAWIYEFYADMGHKGLAFEEQPSAHNTPLYTAPPQRKLPAIIDEIFDRMNKAPRGVFSGHDPMTIWMEAWRAAEQHGIKDA